MTDIKRLEGLKMVDFVALCRERELPTTCSSFVNSLAGYLVSHIMRVCVLCLLLVSQETGHFN